MKSQTLRFFCEPAEAKEWLCAHLSSSGLCFGEVRSNGTIAQVMLEDLRRAPLEGRLRLVAYDAGHQLSSSSFVDLDSVVGSGVGWFLVDLPWISGEQLLLGSLSTKDQTYGKEGGGQGVRMFARASRSLKKLLSFPMIALSLTTGRHHECQIGFSRGAKDWFAAGGKLRQEGVLNVAFELPRGQQRGQV
jgi:hypothetical protein